MDESTRTMLEEAFRLDDEAARDFKRWEAKQRAARVEKSGAPEVIYKRNDNALVRSAEQPQQSAVVEMDAEAMAKWGRWFDNRVNLHLENFAEITGGEISAEFQKLYEEIGGLRAEVEILRSIMSGKTVEIGRKDVA